VRGTTHIVLHQVVLLAPDSSRVVPVSTRSTFLLVGDLELRVKLRREEWEHESKKTPLPVQFARALAGKVVDLDTNMAWRVERLEDTFQCAQIQSFASNTTANLALHIIAFMRRLQRDLACDSRYTRITAIHLL